MNDCAYGRETGRKFIYDNRNARVVADEPDHDEWNLWTEYLADDGEFTYVSDHEGYALDAEEFGPISDREAYWATHGLKAYRKAYNRGWKSANTYGSLDRADADGRSSDVAWMDGYLDNATGREKWHLLFCPDHERCP